jgi:hypothetical protein
MVISREREVGEWDGDGDFEREREVGEWDGDFTKMRMCRR